MKKYVFKMLEVKCHILLINNLFSCLYFSLKYRKHKIFHIFVTDSTFNLSFVIYSKKKKNSVNDHINHKSRKSSQRLQLVNIKNTLSMKTVTDESSVHRLINLSAHYFSFKVEKFSFVLKCHFRL